MKSIHMDGRWHHVQSDSVKSKNWARSTLCCHPLVPSQPTAEEEDEGEDEAPRAELKRAVDEAEDKKEDFDEGGEEKATVDVIKPVPEPEDRATEAEAKGQRRSSVVTASSSRFPFSGKTSMSRFHTFRVSLHALWQRVCRQGNGHQRSVTLL